MLQRIACNHLGHDKLFGGALTGAALTRRAAIPAVSVVSCELPCSITNTSIRPPAHPCDRAPGTSFTEIHVSIIPR
jgi:hypothetical protein